MLTALDNPKEIDENERRFTEIMRKALSKTFTRDIGYHGGGVPVADVHWSEHLGIWVHSRKLSNRYWNAFGTMPPSENRRLQITCEVNMPLRGTDRSIAAVFLIDRDTGDICIGHSGRIGTLVTYRVVATRSFRPITIQSTAKITTVMIAATIQASYVCVKGTCSTAESIRVVVLLVVSVTGIQVKGVEVYVARPML
jgi:hypothetical protein